MSNLNKESIIEMRKLMKKFRTNLENQIIEPCIVKTESEAKELTQKDITGKVWKTGDTYFVGMVF